MKDSVARAALPKKRRWLLDKMPTDAVYAEIGVWQGNFSHWILEITRPRQLHLVDPWVFSPDPRYRETWHGGASAREQADMDDLFRGVAERFAAEVTSGQVVIHRLPSADAARGFTDRFFDWVYIDGDHFYEAVKLDLESWERAVKPGGIIAGDDYRESSTYGRMSCAPSMSLRPRGV